MILVCRRSPCINAVVSLSVVGRTWVLGREFDCQLPMSNLNNYSPPWVPIKMEPPWLCHATIRMSGLDLNIPPFQGRRVLQVIRLGLGRRLVDLLPVAQRINSSTVRSSGAHSLYLQQPELGDRCYTIISFSAVFLLAVSQRS